MKLKQVRLVGFQSWSDMTLDFSDGLNVIIAENNTGKSTFLKFIKLISRPQDHTKEQIVGKIRWGLDRAIGIVSFDDGVIFKITITSKGLVYDKLGSEGNDRFVLRPPEELIDRLGLLIEEKSGYIANIIDEYQSNLMVDSDGTSNYNLLELLTSVPDIDNTLEGIENSHSRLKTGFNEIDIKINQSTRELMKYSYVNIEPTRENLKRQRYYVDNLSTIVDMETILRGLTNKELTLEELNVLEALSDIVIYTNKLNEVRVTPLTEEELDEITEHLKMYNTINECTELMERLPSNTKINRCDLDLADIVLKMYDRIRYIKNIDSKLLHRLDYYLSMHDEINGILDTVESCNKDRDLDISLMEVTLDTYSNIVNILDKITEIKTMNVNILNLGFEIEKLEKEMSEIKVHEFSCPICGGINCCTNSCKH